MADALTTTAASPTVLYEQLEQTHPEYDRLVGEWDLLGDLWDGTGGVAAPYDVIAADNGSQLGDEFDCLPTWKGITYLDRYPRESDKHFRARIRCAAYENYLRDVGETILGFLMRRPATITGLPDWLAEWEETCGAGEVHLDDVERVYSTRLLVFGSCPILLDRPRTQVRSQAEAKALGVRTTVLPLWPQSLRGWSRGPDRDLEWVLLRELATTWPDPFAEPETQQTWTMWSRERIVRATLVGLDTEKVVIDPGLTVNPVPGGVVPLVWAQFGDVAGQGEVATSPLKSCGDICRAIFNRQSEKTDHIRGQQFPILCIPQKFDGQIKGIKVGTDSAFPISPEGNVPMYLAPPPGVAAAFTSEIERLITALYRQARIDWTETGAESGYARAQRFHRTNTQLVSFAQRRAMVRRQIYEVACRWENRDPARELADLEIVIPDDFDVLDLNRELERAEAAMRIGLGPTAEAAIKRSIRDAMVDISDPQDLKDSDAEIEADLVALRGTTPPAGQTNTTMDAEPVEPAEDVAAAQGGDIALGVSTMASIITVNEGRAGKGFPPLAKPDGTPDPDGKLTITDFDAKREAARSAQASTAVVPE